MYTGMKTPHENSDGTFIVDHYYNDSEYLCYENPSNCVAASLIPAENEQFRCEFIRQNSKVNDSKLVIFHKMRANCYVSGVKSLLVSV